MGQDVLEIREEGPAAEGAVLPVGQEPVGVQSPAPGAEVDAQPLGPPAVPRGDRAGGHHPLEAGRRLVPSADLHEDLAHVQRLGRPLGGHRARPVPAEQTSHRPGVAERSLEVAGEPGDQRGAAEDVARGPQVGAVGEPSTQLVHELGRARMGTGQGQDERQRRPEASHVVGTASVAQETASSYRPTSDRRRATRSHASLRRRSGGCRGIRASRDR